MKQTHPLMGVVAILLAAACFASMDSLVRHTGTLLPVPLILWLRYGVQTVAMLIALLAWPVAHGRGPTLAAFRCAHPRFQALRGSLLLATSALGMFGLQVMPVAEFTAIVMLTPVLVTLLATSVLGEQVSRLRWTLVIGAFLGTLLIVRPGHNPFGWAVLFPLAGAACYAVFQVLTSKLSTLESPYTTHFYTGLVGTALATPLLALWQGPAPWPLLQAARPAVLGLVLLIGLLGTVGHLLLILSLGMAPTATLMPFMYAQIAFAAFIGAVFLAHWPDGWAWTGMAVISVCGASCAWLNYRGASRPLPVAVVDAVAD